MLSAQGATWTVDCHVTQCSVRKSLGAAEEPVPPAPPKGKVATAGPPSSPTESAGRQFPEATHRCLLFFIIFFSTSFSSDYPGLDKLVTGEKYLKRHHIFLAR